MRYFAACLAASLLALPAAAQVEQGTITGRVIDQAGAVVPACIRTAKIRRIRVNQRAIGMHNSPRINADAADPRGSMRREPFYSARNPVTTSKNFGPKRPSILGCHFTWPQVALAGGAAP